MSKPIANSRAPSQGAARQLTQFGIHYMVIAPSLIPTKASDRVKTDRRDVEKLARCHRAVN